jgi:hypothetical protein
MRQPDLTIGTEEDPYLRRWWLIPRNPWFNIYLHEFRRSDHDVYHDHPWWFNISILVKGWYIERTPKGETLRVAPAFKLRFGPAPHSIAIDRPAWTIFITGPKYRVWGFLCPKGWVPYDEFKTYSEGVSGQVVDDRGQCP